jgi:hypothetical protein
MTKNAPVAFHGCGHGAFAGAKRLLAAHHGRMMAFVGLQRVMPKNGAVALNEGRHRGCTIIFFAGQATTGYSKHG